MPWRNDANRKRRQEVELFFHRQRPQMSEPGAGQSVIVEVEGVLQEQEVGPDGKIERRPQPGIGKPHHQTGSERGGQNVEEHPGEVYGHDAKNASHVKGLEVEMGCTSIHQDAAYKKSREDEKKVKRGPTHRERALQVVEKRARRICSFLRNRVEDEDHDQSKSPQTIQFDESLLRKRGGHCVLAR